MRAQESVVVRPGSGPLQSAADLIANVKENGYTDDYFEQDEVCCSCWPKYPDIRESSMDRPALVISGNSGSSGFSDLDTSRAIDVPEMEKTQAYHHGEQYSDTDLAKIKAEPLCCWATPRRKCITKCAFVSIFLIALIIFLLIPRSIDIENGEELRELSNNEKIDSGFRLNGVGLPALLRNNNYFGITIRAVDLTTTLPDYPESEFEIKTVASDANRDVYIPARSSAKYNIDLRGIVTTNAGVSLALECGGDPNAFYLANIKGSVIVDSPLVNGFLDMSEENVESSCDLVVGSLGF